MRKKAITHFVKWEVSIKELEELINHLKDCPLISIPLSDDVELSIILKDFKQSIISETSITNMGNWHNIQTTT